MQSATARNELTSQWWLGFSLLRTLNKQALIEKSSRVLSGSVKKMA